MRLAHPTRRKPRLPGLMALGAFLLLAALQPAEAQRVPITFDDYHGYGGTVDYIQRVARAHPAITELLEIGRSTMNRPIYVLVISRMNNGTTIDRHVELRNPRAEGVQNVTPMKSYHGKPGMWIDGGTHGNEYTGTETALYIIDKLVSGYGSDPYITQLIDDNAFYICPMVNPDGVYNSVERGISQRQNSVPLEAGRGSRQTGPQDLNGDGRITSFRYPDPQGRYVMDDLDPRLMVQLDPNEETTKQRYSVVVEGRGYDDAGRGGANPERGIDVNRNFPEGWFNDENEQAGSGHYPGSSPEAHAILEFFTNTRNILLVQSFHTSGGFTYRPFARWPDSRIDPKDLAVFDGIMGKKYIELHPEEENQDRLWRPPYRGDRAYGYGIFIDWAYAQFGSYSMTTELWDWRRDTRGLPGFDGENDRNVWFRALLNHQETAFGGKIFAPWQRYDHPELGQGEIGGWVSTYVGGNALPGESLLHVADVHWQFELFKMGLLPKLEITEASAEVLSGSGSPRIVQVTATVTNTGPLATQVARGTNLAGNREDVIWLIGDRDRIKFLQGSPWERLGVLDGTMEIPGVAPAPGVTGQVRTASPAQGPQRAQPRAQARPGGPQGQRAAQANNSREVSWLISIDGNTPLKIVLTSQKGGTRVHELMVR